MHLRYYNVYVHMSSPALQEGVGQIVGFPSNTPRLLHAVFLVQQLQESVPSRPFSEPEYQNPKSLQLRRLQSHLTHLGYVVPPSRISTLSSLPMSAGWEE